MRLVKNYILKGLTYLASFISVFVLASIIVFLFKTGFSSLSIGLVTDNYNPSTYNALVLEGTNGSYGSYNGEGFYSSKYGIAFIDTINSHKEEEISVAYIDDKSPLKNLESTSSGESLSLEEGQVIRNIYYLKDGAKTYLSRVQMRNAENLVSILEQSDSLYSISFEELGGGIRGAIISTLYLIVISLAIALPIGVSTAIYLNEIARKNKFNQILRELIDTLTGVPSIIYGLMGVAVLFPVTKVFGATSTSILLGGLTLAVILLPTIIRSTEEALLVIPNDLRQASLSLGATKTQTIFRVVLPSSLNGILTGVLLGIARVIGESAALVYTTSTVINDNPSLLEQGSSLSLMIWTLMGGEQPNFELASAISIIILVLVFLINLIVKIFVKRYAKSF